MENIDGFSIAWVLLWVGLFAGIIFLIVNSAKKKANRVSKKRKRPAVTDNEYRLILMNRRKIYGVTLVIFSVLIFLLSIIRYFQPLMGGIILTRRTLSLLLLLMILPGYIKARRALKDPDAFYKLKYSEHEIE
jgi:hypothetical protein